MLMLILFFWEFRVLNTESSSSNLLVDAVDSLSDFCWIFSDVLLIDGQVKQLINTNIQVSKNAKIVAY